jgi:uncharacterized membrane protein
LGYCSLLFFTAAVENPTFPRLRSKRWLFFLCIISGISGGSGDRAAKLPDKLAAAGQIFRSNINTGKDRMGGQSEPIWFVLRSEMLRRTHMRSHPRLLASVAVALTLYCILSRWIGTATAFLIAFDGGAVVFLAAVWIMMALATPEGMRRRAEIEDEGRYAVLGFSAAAAIAILLAIVFELHGIKDRPSALAVVLAAATILLSWLFMNTIFALHYAHGYYGDADPSDEYKAIGGLVFPGRHDPDYWDFMYFSFVVGMTFQVSDVQVEAPKLSREVLAHGVLAFFFNVVIVALTINIVAGLI